MLPATGRIATALAKWSPIRRSIIGATEKKIPGFLALYGWNEIEQMGEQEFTARYVDPTTRTLPVSEIERSVLAVKTGSGH